MPKPPTALETLEANLDILTRRTEAAQREVALCLRWIRIHAQRAAAHAPVGRPPTTRH